MKSVKVPPPAELLSAAHVGEGAHEAAVEQAQPVRAEGGVHAGPVGSVPREQERVAAGPPLIDAIDEGDRDLRAVGGGGVDPLGSIPGGVEAAEDLVLLAQDLLACLHVVVEDGARRGHGAVEVTQDPCIELAVPPGRYAIGGLAEVDLVPLASVPGEDAQADQPRAAHGDHQVVPEQLEALEEFVFAVGNDDLPVLSLGLSDGSPHESEVLRLVVRAQVEVLAEVIQRILVSAHAGQEHLEVATGFVRAEKPHLGSEGVVGDDEDIALRFRLAHAAIESLVAFFVDQLVGGRIGAQHMAVDAVGAQGIGVLLGVEDGAIVVRPLEVAGYVQTGITWDRTSPVTRSLNTTV